MHHRDEWDDDLCPQCNLCRETTNHIHECSNDEAKTERMKGIIKIKNWMRKNDTAPDIVECISLTLIAGSSSTFNEYIYNTKIKYLKVNLVLIPAREALTSPWP